MRMTRRELIDYCLTFPDAYEDYPFHDDVWAVLRHRSNRKAFAFLYEHGGKLCANLKIDPMTGDFLRQAVSYVRPGYHMNKTHWITLVIDDCPGEKEAYPLIEESYRLTKMDKKHRN